MSIHATRVAQSLKSLLSCIGVFALACALATAACAQGTGKIAGSVVDSRTGRAIAFVNIRVPDAHNGALSDSKGDFLISGVPAGTYSMIAQITGYTPGNASNVVVTAGQVTTVKITMEEIVAKTEETVEVKGTRPLVDTKVGGTVSRVRAEDIGHQGLTSLQDVVAQQTGVSNENNQIRVRGGRSDETTFLIDGVANRNPVSGDNTAGSINARSVAEVNVISSGFSARYGQALSGIVDVTLKEGGQKLAGGLSAQGGSWFTQNYNGTLSGPDWVSGGLKHLGIHLPGEASFLADMTGEFSNTYVPSIIDQPGRPRLRSGYVDSFLGHKFTYSSNLFMPAETNNWSALYKWTWRPSNKNKIELAFSKRLAFDQGFARRAIGDLSGQSIPSAWAFHDRLEHYGTYSEDVNSTSLTLTHTFSARAYHTLQVSRYFYGLQYAVDGKNWKDYIPQNDPGLPPGQDRQYFIDSGDDNNWSNSWTESFNTDYRLGINFGKIHKAEFGFQNALQSVQYLSIIDPWVFDVDGLGANHDLWHVYPDQGALYATDRLEYEGFVAEGGARYDYWFPGKQLEKAVADTTNGNISPDTRAAFYKDTAALFGRRVKGIFSPRLSVSHPINNKDKFYFNFGQFTQFPAYYYVYSKLTSVSSEGFPTLGNANLNPEKSVQFEVGAQHVFANQSAGKITLFQKDIYDYPTSVLFHRLQGTVISDFNVYLNSDFSRSRGFELEYETQRIGNWKWKGTYEFSVAKGKASDPNQAKIVEEGGGNASEPPLSEGYLFWNRPHKLTLLADFRAPEHGKKVRALGVSIPNGFGANFFASVQSGKAYTPTDATGNNPTGRVYSKNGPLEVLVNVRLNQEFNVTRQNRMNFYVIAENLLNWKVVNRLDPFTGQAPQAGEGIDTYRHPTPFTVNGTLDNPFIYGPPLRVRLGLDYDF